MCAEMGESLQLAFGKEINVSEKSWHSKKLQWLWFLYDAARKDLYLGNTKGHHD